MTDKEIIDNLRNTITYLTKRLENSDSDLLVMRNRELEDKLEGQAKLVGVMVAEIKRLRGD